MNESKNVNCYYLVIITLFYYCIFLHSFLLINLVTFLKIEFSYIILLFYLYKINKNLDDVHDILPLQQKTQQSTCNHWPV